MTSFGRFRWMYDSFWPSYCNAMVAAVAVFKYTLHKVFWLMSHNYFNALYLFICNIWLYKLYPCKVSCVWPFMVLLWLFVLFSIYCIRHNHVSHIVLVTNLALEFFQLKLLYQLSLHASNLPLSPSPFVCIPLLISILMSLCL